VSAAVPRWTSLRGGGMSARRSGSSARLGSRVRRAAPGRSRRPHGCPACGAEGQPVRIGIGVGLGDSHVQVEFVAHHVLLRKLDRSVRSGGPDLLEARTMHVCPD
jgi:hypothetical protein